MDSRRPPPGVDRATGAPPPPVRRMGRPPLYTDAQRQDCYARYLAGDSLKEIGAALGVHPTTIGQWAKKGEWSSERTRRRQMPEHLELELARLAARVEKRSLTYAETHRLSMLTRALERLRRAAPTPKPRPVVRNALRADLLERVLADDYGLLPYQQAFLRDESRYRCILKARQIGYSYVMGLAALLGLAAGRSQVIVSASEDQARLVMGHMRAHAQRLELPIAEAGREITLAGSTAICLSTNWRTSQGYTGDVWFDEFAWAPKPDALWGAVTPAITRVGGRITVCSTPFLPGALFWKIATNHQNRWDHFTRDRITLAEAIAQGMPVPGGIEELRLNFDAATWALFYECQWAEDGQSLVSWERLEAAADDSPLDPDRYGRLALGVDVGRVHDRTALVLVGEEADRDRGAWSGRVRLLRWQELQGLTFAAQRAEIARWLDRWPIARVVIDRTGLGMQLAEELARDYPALVEGRAFTAPVKERLALGLLRLFEQGSVRLPRDPDLWARLHAVRRESTGASIRYDAPRDHQGHADAFWALALACERAAPSFREPQVMVWR